MVYDLVTSTVHNVPYFARGVCIQNEAPDLPAGFRVATAEEVAAAFPPGPEPVPEYSKLKIIDALIAMGVEGIFAQQIQSASLAVQLRYGASVSLKGDDPDFVAMMSGLQQAFGMSDEQRIAFLKQCEA